jgi:integrase
MTATLMGLAGTRSGDWAMARLRIRYVWEDRDRHGNVRRYFVRGGAKKIRLRAEPGTAEFATEYERALAVASYDKQPKAGSRVPAPRNSLRWLVEQYYGSAEFKRLDVSTRAARRGILDSICVEPISTENSTLIGSLPFASMPPSKVRALRDRKAELPEAANGRVKALRQIFHFAVLNEYTDRNPAKEVPYLKSPSQGFHTWTIDEVLQFVSKHPVGTKAYLALALLLFTGQRRSDVVKFGRQHVKAGWLTFTQHKNRNRKPVTLSIPILPWLQAAIDAGPCGELTFLTTDFNRPFSSNGFGNKMRKWCDGAGLPDCTSHGLRKAGACIAAENGATERQLMAIFGWQTMKEAAHYTKMANQKRLAAEAMPLLSISQIGNKTLPLLSPDLEGGSFTKKKAKNFKDD